MFEDHEARLQAGVVDLHPVEGEPRPNRAPQKPWLGLAQWVALVGASTLLAILNLVLRGRGLDQIPAVDVAAEAAVLVLITAPSVPSPR